jgi:3',5'-cyclic-AMP phosphodiesterase
MEFFKLTNQTNRLFKERTLFVIFSIVVLFSSCDKFEYSPYQTEPTAGELPSELNLKNLSILHSDNHLADDTVTLVYLGDSQRFYDDLASAVEKVNSLRNVDFLILCGDITDFGLVREYIWIVDILNELNIPYFCAIGNHDIATDEGEIYTQIFGNKNFSFEYKKYKFLIHDTNGREYAFNGNVPDMHWLSSQLNDPSPDWFIGISHIPPFDNDFDKNLEHPYKDLLAATDGFLVSLNGHLHRHTDSNIYYDNVRYMTCNSLNKKEFTLLKFINGQIIKEMISY